MNYYALLYDLVNDMVVRRAPFREEHLRLARESRERGELVMGGALTEPIDRALLVFHAADKSTVEAFVHNDPYVMNGLVKNWEVRPWNVVVGNEPPAASSASTSAAPAPGNILRRWTARTTEALLPKYLEHFSNDILPELRRLQGYSGATVSTRRLESETEIVVETIWHSLEAIRNFAGPDIEAAVVADHAAALLTSFDRRVVHSQVALAARH